jgi:CYTH domain-containing protein
VRIKPDIAVLAIKGTKNGVSRIEYEYQVPINEAEHILEELCEKPIIEKNRYKIGACGLLWDVDEFLGVNKGLVVAEVHLEDENQSIELPEWVGREVSHELKYYNSNLVQNPFTEW